VTLEPCSHVGKTGPCADALIAAGVARVVGAMRDPNPLVDGAGFERLRAAGIDVEFGLMEALARALNRGFLSRIERGRPWLRVKLAISIDGRSALASGDSKWISGAAARQDVQRWRARSGAILTGAGTVLIDDPLLTARLDESAADYERDFVPPLRVVLDPGLATVARGRIREGDAPTLYIHAPDARMPRGIDAQHMHAPVHAGRFDLDAVLKLLGDRGINEVQVEAGATLAGGFLAAGLVDELLLYVAPVILGERARPMFDGLPIDTMEERLRMRIIETRRIGDDVRLLMQPQSRQ
jgi:diaminohydroxyphosphoribosylaminopyrimidine deaminase/5-amino-6-(5-phosphoribosylamino)uracil reductase